MKKYILFLLLYASGFAQFNPVQFYNYGKKNNSDSFVSTWNTANTSTGSSTSTQAKLPLVSAGVYNFTVDWGDGNSDAITVWNQAETTHTYPSSGTYSITITGDIKGWAFANTGDRLKITSVSTWGCLRFISGQEWFRGCANLNLLTVSDQIPLQGVSSMNGSFRGCTNLTYINNIETLNVSSLTALINVFSATKFNQDISGWNVSNVTNMGGLFSNATLFNQDISGWNVSNVTNMGFMFEVTPAFNRNIGNWNVSNVATFTSFMAGKTAANFSTTNLDAIYNGWTNRIAVSGLTITFGTAKYTSAATEGRALLTRANSTKSITNAVNNGSGLIRISATAHGLSTGNKCFISGVLGTTEANGAWIVTVIDADTIDLQASTFTNTYTSAGTLRTGYGWTITDGGI